ncbi:hypothetical protein D3C80_1712370 [compost metagenome]
MINKIDTFPKTTTLEQAVSRTTLRVIGRVSDPGKGVVVAARQVQAVAVEGSRVACERHVDNDGFAAVFIWGFARVDHETLKFYKVQYSSNLRLNSHVRNRRRQARHRDNSTAQCPVAVNRHTFI